MGWMNTVTANLALRHIPKYGSEAMKIVRVTSTIDGGSVMVNTEVEVLASLLVE